MSNGADDAPGKAATDTRLAVIKQSNLREFSGFSYARRSGTAVSKSTARFAPNTYERRAEGRWK